MALKFYTGVAKELKLKFSYFWGLIRTFVEVKGEKLVGGGEGLGGGRGHLIPFNVKNIRLAVYL